MNLLKLKFLGKFKDFGLLAMRLGVGGMFVFVHGAPKVMGGPDLWVKIGGAMGNLGVSFAPTFWGFMSAMAEFCGAILIVLGFMTRPAAAILCFNMIVAMTMHFAMHQGIDVASHAIEVFFVFACLLFTGPGKYSIDRD